ncbi:hypothetical protein [Lichenifustis flavocetrariae]|uniref:Uncharacterized protein n=1 Tax=Lichenifustis flavocetrariae TaxID=2949735 RepID=A0AA41Z9U4_9HYPH|nr:hypothetical protein [Lichenifustis flavocetrariae]MCW6512940.1 hypothetical protein [Lichenifustis flavocetrariae]
MSQPEFTRRSILASSALAGGAALTGAPAASAAGASISASSSPEAPIVEYHPGSEPGQ